MDLVAEAYVIAGIHLKYSITLGLAKGHFYSSTFLQGLSFLLELAPNSPPPPMNSVSITGNNRPSSFITSWRWFPHGATGSLWCQPASQPASQPGSRRREQERDNKECRPAYLFPYRLPRGDLRPGFATVICETDRRWTEACQLYKVIYCLFTIP